MHVQKFLLFEIVVCSLLFSGCSGGGSVPDVQKPQVQEPEVTPQRPEVTVQKPKITPGNIQPKITPGNKPALTPAARGTLNVQIPTPRGTLPPVTLTKVTPLSKYDSAQMITAFAGEYLGLNVSVSNAAGAKGNINLPSIAQADINAAVSHAGQVASGVISANGSQGAAQVAVGSGTISGDLNADISGASEGAYTLVVRTTSPTDANAALALIRATYPALANVNLQLTSNSQGAFVFYATTTHQGVDWKTKQVTGIAEAVVAGTTRQDPATVVWVMIGNGTYAASVKP